MQQGSHLNFSTLHLLSVRLLFLHQLVGVEPPGEGLTKVDPEVHLSS